MRQPQASDASAITRPVLEDYLSWLLAQGYSASTRALSLSMIRVLFEGLPPPRLAPGPGRQRDHLRRGTPLPPDEIARFIPESVMAQLESDEALSKIPHATTRNLIVVLIETGLRGGDACNLPFNPVLTDSSGWPCLRFEAVKVRAEQLIPLSAKAAAAIAAQQDHVRQHWPAGSPWLFPGIATTATAPSRTHTAPSRNSSRTGSAPSACATRLSQPVTVTGHQFRHTLGTRLINSGVPSTWCKSSSGIMRVIFVKWIMDGSGIGGLRRRERLSSWPISAQVRPWSRAA
jgi:integrase